MIDKGLRCPFCGGTVWIATMDDEGNVHSDDYADEPWSGLSFGLLHGRADVSDGELCPIESKEILGNYQYDSIDEAVIAWTGSELTTDRSPVQIGDELWVRYDGKIFPVTVFEIKSIDRLVGDTLHTSRRIGVIGRRPKGEYTRAYKSHFNWSSIGKSIFRTEDDAKAGKRK